MTPERIAELRDIAETRAGDRYNRAARIITECLDEVERLTKERDEATAKAEQWVNAGLYESDRRVQAQAVAEKYRRALEYIGEFHGDEDCTAQLVVMARVALEGQ